MSVENQKNDYKFDFQLLNLYKSAASRGHPIAKDQL